MFEKPFWANRNWHMLPVGSRVTCNPKPFDTDEDWLILDDCDVLEKLQSFGFISEGDPQFYTGNDNGSFRSLRLANYNAIVTPDMKFFNLFMTATELAKRFNLLEKNDRIALFQAVLYGVTVSNLK